MKATNGKAATLAAEPKANGKGENEFVGGLVMPVKVSFRERMAAARAKAARSGKPKSKRGGKRSKVAVAKGTIRVTRMLKQGQRKLTPAPNGITYGIGYCSAGGEHDDRQAYYKVEVVSSYMLLCEAHMRELVKGLSRARRVGFYPKVKQPKA
jgi:hypothetical protein